MDDFSAVSLLNKLRGLRGLKDRPENTKATVELKDTNGVRILVSLT